MTIFTIRPGSGSDLADLLILFDQLGYPTTLDMLEEHYNRFMSQSGAGMAVAVDQDFVIGLIIWSKTCVILTGKTRFHIEALVVHDAYRGQGVGKQLIQFLEKVAASCRPSIIDLTSGIHRAKDGTHAFYHTLGYRNEGEATKLYLRKALD